MMDRRLLFGAVILGMLALDRHPAAAQTAAG